MGMPQPAPNWTVEQVLALPDDGNRYEVVDGELLVTPAPMFRHQDAILALVRRLEPFVRSNRVGDLSISPADIELDDHTLVQPDIFVFELPEVSGPSGGRTSEACCSPLRYCRQVRRAPIVRSSGCGISATAFRSTGLSTWIPGWWSAGVRRTSGRK